jgi:lysophospholipase L1-like esterase
VGDRRPQLCGVLVLAAVLSGCGADADPAGSAAGSSTTSTIVPAPSIGPAPSITAVPPAPAAVPLAVVAVGDSITAADSPDVAAGAFGPGSWVPAAEGPGVDVTGGWAVPGATTADMRAGVQPLRADALVVMAGTNDVRQGLPWAESAAALDGIVTTVGVARVLVCSIVPLTEDPAAVAEYNGRLAELAAVEGWEFVDCGASVRDPSGGWLPGTTYDGIHPTVDGARRIGATVHQALVG